MLQGFQSFETSVKLTQVTFLKLDWWATKRNLVNRRSVMTLEPDPTMEIDVSLMGWGAVCKGIRTGRLSSQMECRDHINYLELLAAMFAVKSFAKDRRDAHVYLRMDNRTAIFSVN